MPSKMWDEITYPFPNFNSCWSWEWMSNSIPYFMMDAITYPCCDQGWGEYQIYEYKYEY